MDRLTQMLEMQLQLQQNHMKDGDPRYLKGDSMADFMRWNGFALEDELHEAMAEVGWKPWATSRHINDERFLQEMVDGWHLFMNMLLCGLGQTPEIIAERFYEAYMAKNAVNAQRQIDGYDGIKGKCYYCHREVPGEAVFSHQGHDFCSEKCAVEADG